MMPMMMRGYFSKNPLRQFRPAGLLGLGVSAMVFILLSCLAFADASNGRGDAKQAGNSEAQPQQNQRTRRRRLETIKVNRTTADDAVLKLVGPNIVTRNETLYSFSTVCLGIFEVNDAGNENVWPNTTNRTWPRSGIILSTGSADSIVGPNEAGATTSDPDAAFKGTPAPSPIFSMGNSEETSGEGIYYDACHLEFEFKCIGSSDSSESEPTSFSYVFGSEDYPEYIDGINDDFRFLLNGVDMALLNNSRVDSFVDAINEEDNSQLFVKNDPNNPSYNIEADGFTSVLTAFGTCNPSINDGWNKIMLVIADEFDKGSDSWVLLGASSFVVGAPQSPPPSQMPSARPSFAPSFAPTPVSTGTLTMRRTAPPSTMPSSEPTPDGGGDGGGVGAGQPTLQPSTIEVTPRQVICQCPPDEE